jgi:hypothetical protein
MTTTRAASNPALFVNMRANLIGRMKSVRRMAEEGDDRAALLVARREMAGLVDVVLELLVDEHVPDADGRCVQCRSWRWFRRNRETCRMVIGINLAFAKRYSRMTGVV